MLTLFVKAQLTPPARPSHKALAAVATSIPIELHGPALDRRSPAAGSSKRADGGIDRLASDGLPDIRRVKPGRDAAGRGWIGLRANEDYVVAGVDQAPATADYGRPPARPRRDDAGLAPREGR